MAEQIKVIGRRQFEVGGEGTILGTDRSSDLHQEDIDKALAEGVARARCPCCMRRLLIMPVNKSIHEVNDEHKLWLIEE